MPGSEMIMAPASHAATPSRLGVRLGLFAILFQAMLFAWHHHPLVLSGSLPAPVIANGAGPTQPADDEDGCEICSVLLHLTGAPVDFMVAPPPPPIAAAIVSGETAMVAEGPALAFQARAPPLA
jgi:hypothetical protein